MFFFLERNLKTIGTKAIGKKKSEVTNKLGKNKNREKILHILSLP